MALPWWIGSMIQKKIGVMLFIEELDQELSTPFEEFYVGACMRK